jgi:hypothetical protein
MAPCAQFETVFILVILPMSKNAFMALKDKYIQSVATTAGVRNENVNIVSVAEISARASRMASLRMLLATSVSVHTSVLLVSGQKMNFDDHSLLNSNLIKNGLPKGTLAQQNKLPSPNSNTSQIGTEATSDIPLVAIVGGALGFAVMVLCVILFHRIFRGSQRTNALPTGSSVSLLFQVLSQWEGSFCSRLVYH